MNQFRFTPSLIRELRGSPLTALVAMLYFEQTRQVPITAQMLKDATGLRDHSITDSLHILCSPMYQIAVKVKYGWRLASNFQFALEFQNPDFEEIREKRESLPTTTTARLEGTRGLLSAAAAEKEENREIRESYIEIREKRESPHKPIFSPDQRLIHQILTDSLVGEPMATTLALIPDLEPIYVMAHCMRADLENIERGLLIHRIRNRDAVSDTYRRKAEVKLDQMEF